MPCPSGHLRCLHHSAGHLISGIYPGSPNRLCCSLPSDLQFCLLSCRSLLLHPGDLYSHLVHVVVFCSTLPFAFPNSTMAPSTMGLHHGDSAGDYSLASFASLDHPIMVSSLASPSLHSTMDYRTCFGASGICFKRGGEDCVCVYRRGSSVVWP